MTRRVKIDDRAEIRRLLNSKGVTTWDQGPIPGTNLYLLAQPSPQHKGDPVIQFVCDKELAKT